MALTFTRKVSILSSAGDEGPAALAIVQASPMDCGLYRCTIHNEHGSASTDFCLSPEGECPAARISAGLAMWVAALYHAGMALCPDRQPEGSGILFFSTQCCLASSPGRKVKVCRPSGYGGGPSTPAPPFAGFPSLGVYSPP